MRILALDIGQTRVGLSTGETSTKMAFPLSIIALQEVLANSRLWRQILDDERPDMLLFGLPYSLNGEIGKQAKHIKELALQIAQKTGLPFDFCDERLSSKEAKRVLRAQGLSEKQMRGKLDSVAASLFLENWLANYKA